MDLTIQIVSYKTKHFLEPLIKSVLEDLKDTALKFNIAILENASGDDLSDLENKWPNVKIYYSKKNLGFGAGHNWLSEKTKAINILLLNPDLLIIEPHTIARLLETMKKEKASIVGPRLLTPRKRYRSRPLYELSKDQLKIQRWDHGLKNSKLYFKHNKIIKVTWVSGAVFLINHQDFIKIGRFYEGYFMYLEEQDLCNLLKQAGCTTIYDPTIKVLHLNGAVGSKKTAYYRESWKLWKKRKELYKF